MTFGTVATIYYLTLVREKKLEKLALDLEQSYQKEMGSEKKAEGKPGGKVWTDWLKETQFYIFGGVYMFARLALNVTATMQPLYLTTVTGFVAKEAEGTSPIIAAVPLCSYICSLLFSVYFQAPLT